MTHYYTDNSELKSNKKIFDYCFDNEKFTFTTDNGVFSKNNIDYGSYLLIKNTYKKILGTNVLDLGCGYGPIGIIIKRFQKELLITAVDVNSRAISLGKQNANNNHVDIEYYLTSDITSLNKKYDSVLLNPPIRAGKNVIFDLYEKAHTCLNDGGSLYIVIQKKQGANSSISKLKEKFKEVVVLDKDSGYFVISAIK